MDIYSSINELMVRQSQISLCFILPMNCATMQANTTRRCMKFSMFWGRLIFSILLFWQQMILFLCSHQGAKLNINDERSDLGEINTIFNRNTVVISHHFLIVCSSITYRYIFSNVIFFFNELKLKYHHVVHSWMVSTEIK